MTKDRREKPGRNRAENEEVSPAERAFWRKRGLTAAQELGTPCLVFAAEPLEARRGELESALAGLPVRHWWSFKTLPLRPAVQWWRGHGGGVEVVSEFELGAALGLGIPAIDILVNGPAKHTWLPRHRLSGLRVNLDSLAEAKALAPQARELGWSLGIRLSTSAEDNFEYPGIRAPFGVLPSELGRVLGTLRRARVTADVLHFHLRTNVPEARYYREAADEAMAAAGAAEWEPGILDLGGGFPPPRVRTRKGTALDAGFSLASLRDVLVGIRARHRGLRELWLENGRWLTASCGALVVSVLDVKEARGARVLVCDGGRTLQAMVATWERHALIPARPRRGPPLATMVHGPTCMTFDNLGLHDLPRSVRAGDVLLWLDAGAYQLSWETRFSHGLAAVAWTSGAALTAVRSRESLESWLRGR